MLIGLRTYAEKYDIHEVDKLAPEVLGLLQKSQDELRKLMDRNVFFNAVEA